MVLLGIILWAVFMAMGYVSHADIDDNLKTTFYAVAIIAYIVIFALAILFSL